MELNMDVTIHILVQGVDIEDVSSTFTSLKSFSTISIPASMTPLTGKAASPNIQFVTVSM